MIEHLRQVGIVIERNTELINFDQSTNSVQATLKTKAGIETIKATYLCACDGARSTVREALKLDSQGELILRFFM